MKYQSTKTYGHDLGLSVCFRQHKAEHSHCRWLHGYALAFKFVFEADDLDARNWVVDFGGLKDLKVQLVHYFDHKLIVAQDDPQLDAIAAMAGLDVADAIVLNAVGCEAFAEFGFNLALNVIHKDDRMRERVRVVSCEVSEHGANSAIFYG